MPTLHAVIFDVDGTLAETERDGHRVAFNLAFRDCELPYQWEVGEYGELLRITGGQRRLERYLRAQGHSDTESASLAQTLHPLKTKHFAEWVRAGCVQARPGTVALMRNLVERDVAVAVATTGSAAWVRPLLALLFDQVPFATVVTGDDVSHLKPHPAAYLRALHQLQINAVDALAIEDSPPGLEAALGAGLGCVVVTSEYTCDEAFPGAAAVVPGYLATDLLTPGEHGDLGDGVTAEALIRVHASLSAPSPQAGTRSDDAASPEGRRFPTSD